MALGIYKQRPVPLIDETQDKPDNSLDPLYDVLAGIGSDGLLYAWQDVGLGYHWDLMTLEQERYWCQIWDYKKDKIFSSKTDANGDLIDAWFWGADIKMIVIENLNFTLEDFTINSDTVTFSTGNPGADMKCVIFRN